MTTSNARNGELQWLAVAATTSGLYMGAGLWLAATGAVPEGVSALAAGTAWGWYAGQAASTAGSKTTVTALTATAVVTLATALA